MIDLPNVEKAFSTLAAVARLDPVRALRTESK